MQKLQDLKLSVVSLKKELAWAFVAEKKQVENMKWSRFDGVYSFLARFDS